MGVRERGQSRVVGRTVANPCDDRRTIQPPGGHGDEPAELALCQSRADCRDAPVSVQLLLFEGVTNGRAVQKCDLLPRQTRRLAPATAAAPNGRSVSERRGTTDAVTADEESSSTRQSREVDPPGSAKRHPPSRPVHFAPGKHGSRTCGSPLRDVTSSPRRTVPLVASGDSSRRSRRRDSGPAYGSGGCRTCQPPVSRKGSRQEEESKPTGGRPQPARAGPGE